MSTADGTPIETGRRFVNTWECDENAHMNVQFYAAHFEEAEPHFWLAAGLAGLAPRALARHLRFHRELHVSDACVVRTALTGAGDGHALLCHFMERDDGALAATCLTGLAAPLDAVRAAAPAAPVIALPEAARPRSVSPSPPHGAGSAAMRAAGFVPTYRGLVQPRDCDSGGEMMAQLYVARFSDAAGHIWRHLGFGREWRRANGVGTVAVEVRLDIAEPLRAGDPVLLLSGLTGHAARTITFRHEIFDMRRDRVAAHGEVTALAMDLAARRAIAWPEADRARLGTLLCRPAGA